ncbi:MAG: Hsp33 family molecular chaperone HslO [Clostridia bacterium]|nr:Hsp33 family molecular chaperone HslO [Clostridia bacterium]
MDKIYRSLAFDGQVSLTVLETTELINRAVRIHGTGWQATKLLGGLLTCAAYLASSLKEETGSVSLTVKAKDGDGAVSVSADKALHVRGYADGSCESTLKGGTLTVVREDGFSRPFVGTCEIGSDDVSDILSAYFGQSEQIPTVVKIEVEVDGSGECVSAGAVVMQLLPDAEEQAIWQASNVFDKFCTRKAISGGQSEKFDAEEVFNRYFSAYVSGEVTTLFPQYKCNCSEHKIRGVLASLGKAELIKIAREQGAVKVHCHYCNKDYIYDEKRIEETF